MKLKERFLAAALVSSMWSAAPAVTDQHAPNPNKKPAAWLGIMFTDIPAAQVPTLYKHPSSEGAVRIQQVIHGASAFQAGLKEGDYILSVNGTPLSGRKTLLDSVTSKPIGAIIELRIGRDEKVFDQKMALSPRPEDMRAITRMLVGSDAPELEGKYYAGDVGPLSKNKGKVVVLDFWATWCGPCRMTIPSLDSLSRKYKDKGLIVVGISSENVNDLKTFQSASKQGYSLFNDISQLTTHKYQAFSYPTLVLIDRKGVVQRIEVGAHPMEDMERWILELL